MGVTCNTIAVEEDACSYVAGDFKVSHYTLEHNDKFQNTDVKILKNKRLKHWKLYVNNKSHCVRAENMAFSRQKQQD